ncbi:molybdopterin-dependent oxidoreductase [Salmonella enterica subsp. enterica serovar Weltevreden]|nr:molybdopterin-dependent oxidoreductase [Salmonella enterica subsp. enterica serovar Weltevreden]
MILRSIAGHEGVFSAADRGFQRFFKAVEPKWDLKTDWQIISEIAADGLSDALQQHRRSGMRLRHLCPDFYGAARENGREAGLYPVAVPHVGCRSGTSYLFKEVRYPNGLARFFTCDWVAYPDKLTERVPDGTVDGARSRPLLLPVTR